MNNEKILQQQCEDYLKLKKIQYLHLTTRLIRKINNKIYVFPVPGMTGWPDLVIFMPYHVILVELKRKKHFNITKEQKELFEILEKYGHHICIINNFDNFKELIDHRLFICQSIQCKEVCYSTAAVKNN